MEDIVNTITDIDYEVAELCNKDDVKELESYLIPILYSLVIIFGFLGNVIVIIVLVIRKHLKSLSDIYLLNLVISDMILIFTLPFWAHSVVHNWIFGDEGCRILTGLFNIGYLGGVFFIILLTIDRYIAIVYAVFSIKVRTINFGLITSSLTWIVALFISIPSMVFTSQSVTNNIKICGPNYQYMWKIFQIINKVILGLVLPILVMIICYTGIIKTLLRCKNKKKRNRAVILIFSIMVGYFLFWAPHNIVILISFSDIETKTCNYYNNLDRAKYITETLGMTHCCVNPIIYAFVGEKFRRYFLELFQRCCTINIDISRCNSMSSRDQDIFTGLKKKRITDK
ncbi:membrane protein E1 [Brazilian porcupinepox virus 1]|nr:membrane protein E1 [Brazilian porcupinepox virus 1]